MLEHTPGELSAALAERGHKRFRVDQLIDWVYVKQQGDPARMSNLPRALWSDVRVLTSAVADRRDTPDGCVKLLLSLADDERVECVLIPDGDRATACVSTQVGCAMGCTFCATGRDGLVRNLTSGEVLEQVLHLAGEGDRRVTNVVLMGMGEPLANYDASVAAVRAVVDPRRFNLSARKVTLSTVGLPEGIRRLAGEDLPITLAVSLHAPNDELRSRLIPPAMVHPLEEVLAAARVFYQARHREVTLEYLLLGGINDTPACASQLAALARGVRCNVNLIRYNPVEGSAFEPPSESAMSAFAERLRSRGVNVTIRRSRGLAAEAACGQLRRRPRES